MRRIASCLSFLVFCTAPLILSSCSSMSSGDGYSSNSYSSSSGDYSSRLPQQIATNGEKTVVVDPHTHVWGAYGQDGTLLKAGLATAGSDYCSDLGRPCRTSVGTFHVASLGSPNCKSSLFPMPRGGAPMPYCMFFNHSQALHGVPDGEVVEGNISHGCVRMHVADAEWLRYNFVNVGTKVIVKPY